MMELNLSRWRMQLRFKKFYAPTFFFTSFNCWNSGLAE
jgi:hypothetical protein